MLYVMELLLFSVWFAMMAATGLCLYRAQQSLKKFQKTHKA